MFISINDGSLCEVIPDKIERVQWIRNAGYDAIEMRCGTTSSIGHLNPSDLSQNELKEFKKILDIFEKVDLHAMCYNKSDYTLLSPDELIRCAFREELKAVCGVGERLGVDTITIHCGSTRAPISEDEAQLIFAGELPKINKIASEHGVRFAIEVCDYLQPADKYELFPEIEELDNLGINLDTGHMTIPGGAGCKPFPFEGPAYKPYGSIAGFIRRFGKNIIHVHIHDYDFYWPKRQCGHRPIGTGVIDFGAVVSALYDVGYKGSLSSELKLSLDVIEAEAKTIKALIEKYATGKK
jgi:sugar phosphate isomerase/epimerase